MAIAKNQMSGLTAAMYEDMNTNATISIAPNTLSMGMGSITTVSSGGTGSSRPHTEQILDRYSLNELTVEHRVQEFELIKLRETNVDYADHIKSNLAKMASEEVTRKMTFTKKSDINTDTHSFRGRVWVFSKEELTQMIEEIRNGI